MKNRILVFLPAFVCGICVTALDLPGLHHITLTFAATFIFLIAFLRIPVLSFTQHPGLRLGALVSSMFLFYPVSTLPGTCGPVCVRLETREQEQTGRGAGTSFPFRQFQVSHKRRS